MTYPNEQAPFYMQLREIVRCKIETGEYAPCTALPSENELADEYATNRQTVRNAIDTLVNEGLLRRVAGKGVYVLGKKMERDLDNSEPVSLEEIYVPKNLVPKISGIDLSVFSLYEIYELYGINLERAYQTLDLVHLEQNDARMLDMDAALPVMLFECTSYDDRGRIIEFSRSYTRGDKGRFSVNFKR